jgi:hypothetical protein
MSSEITTAFVKQFHNMLFHLSQQKGSRLESSVRNESQKSEEQFFERLGPVAAQKRTSRHSDTPQIDTPHSRRRVTLTDYEWADLIDDQDKIRMLLDPASDYLRAAVYAFGRAKDDEIIENAVGNAYSGKEGGTAVAVTNSERLVAHDGSSTAPVSLNIKTLRAAKKYFDQNEVDPDIPRYIAINSSNMQDGLLGENEVISSDYNTNKALTKGKEDSFMGFKFIQLERLSNADDLSTENFAPADGSLGAGGGTIGSSAIKCLAWAEDGLLCSKGEDIMTRVSERDDKSYSTQVYARMSIGATRMEEAKYLEIICAE